MENQKANEEQLKEALRPFTAPNGRLAVYADLHRWTRVKSLLTSLFDLTSVNIKERMQMYDFRTAAYKFCVALGGQPAYRIEAEDYLMDVRDMEQLRQQPAKAVRDEIRHGNLCQWMSVFYHENPSETFNEPLSYERALEAFLLQIGEWDGGEMHYKRFVKADEQAQRKLYDSHQAWNKCLKRHRQLRFGIAALSGIWLFLVFVFDIPSTIDFQKYAHIYCALPLMPAIIAMLVTRSYFRGHGFFVNTIWAAIGVLSSLVPAVVVWYTANHYPTMVRWVVLLMSVLYIWFALRECMPKPAALANDETRNVFHVDENKALLERLFYTFKTKSFKFKGSNFGALDDMVGEANAARYESELTCTLWGVLLVILILVFVVFH
ncbi:MAG: hypothetical protein HUK03_10540, partial [Bacteroidaceae bacterium]|nr:hypothetical protein [Bacteroidaceae bacterium]